VIEPSVLIAVILTVSNYNGLEKDGERARESPTAQSLLVAT